MFTNWSIFEGYKNFKLTDDIKDKLNKYFEILTRENNKFNLTRIVTIEDVFEKHFLDSLLFTQEIELTTESIADIGSGPGFPGVIIKIFFPNTKVLLIESNNKKAIFLRTLISELDLADIEVSEERAEELSLKHHEQFDIVISRAVAYLDILLEIGVQMLKVDGLFIALKGPKAEEELKYLRGKDERLGLTLKNKQVLEDAIYGIRINLFYSKIKPTADIYPRKYSTIKKESK